ncbi:hypothetical protein [Streptomyces sp. NBC_01373]|nr:hypothetical protein [Streptomyces sp. NBC_01373]MCX4704182.1 hypothetical protein [Streptomyces sp. NBC_01373]
MSSDEVRRPSAPVVAAVVIYALQAAVRHAQPAGRNQQDRS